MRIFASLRRLVCQKNGPSGVKPPRPQSEPTSQIAILPPRQSADLSIQRISARWQAALEECESLMTERYRLRSYYHWNPEQIISNWRKALLKASKWEMLVKENEADYDVSFSTGSGSGSLVGFARTGKLLPTGEMLQRGDVAPFCGELFIGAGGINKNSVSLSTSIKVAMEYAERPFNVEGWDPEKGIERRSCWESYLAEKKGIKNESPSGERALYQGHDLLEASIEAAEINLQIEEKRQRLWSQLTEIERDFVSVPFPVVYGVVQFSAGEISSTPFNLMHGTDTKGEVAHQGNLPIEHPNCPELGRLVLYVPQEKIGVVRQYFKIKEIKVSIQPLAPLEAVDCWQHLLSLITEVKKSLAMLKDIDQMIRRLP
jgi:hypothetical protein